ncbi:MAG: hypothetical protein ACJ8AH_10390 [Stellaceae bacterium]
MTQTRRLAAILAVDGGYSRLMEADGEGTHPGMPGEIISDAERDQIGMVGDIIGFAGDSLRNPQTDRLRRRSTSPWHGDERPRQRVVLSTMMLARRSR